MIRKTSLSSDRSDSTAVKQCRQSANPISTSHDFRRTRLDRIPRSEKRIIRDLRHGDARSDPTSSRCQISRIASASRTKRRGIVFSTDETKPGWWSQTGSNRRPPACKAGALPTELWPRSRFGPPPLTLRRDRLRARWLAKPQLRRSEGWWAWEDLNFRPHAYQARALTN